MHEGVVRDMDQQRLRAERQLDFDTQAALEAKLRQEQDVNDGRGGLFSAFSRKT
jgi:protein PET117